MPDEDSGQPAESPSPSSTVPGPASGTKAVPASYVGTWEGPAVGLDGAVPMGTFRVTVQQAAVGDKLGTFRQTDQIGGICDDVLILKQVTKTRLVVTSIAAKTNRNVCTTGSHRVLPHPGRRRPEVRDGQPGGGGSGGSDVAGRE